MVINDGDRQVKAILYVLCPKGDTEGSECVCGIGIWEL